MTINNDLCISMNYPYLNIHFLIILKKRLLMTKINHNSWSFEELINKISGEGIYHRHIYRIKNIWIFIGARFMVIQASIIFNSICLTRFDDYLLTCPFFDLCSSIAVSQAIYWITSILFIFFSHYLVSLKSFYSFYGKLFIFSI